MASSEGAPQPGSGAPSDEGAPAGSHPAPRAPNRRRGLRIFSWVLVAVTAVAGLAVAGALWVLEHLDHPRVKPRVLALVRTHAGLELEYDELRVSPSSGLRARSLRILQPARWRGIARDFVRIDDLEVRAGIAELLGDPTTIDAVRAGAIALTVVREQDGETTLSALFPPEAAPAQEETQLSHALSELPSMLVREVAVAAVRGRAIELFPSAPVRTTTLATVALGGTVATGPTGVRGTALTITGAPSLRLEQEQGGEVHHAELTLKLALHGADDRSAALSVASGLLSQDLRPDFQGGARLLALDARAAFDPTEGSTTLTLSRLHALDGALAAEAEVELSDAEPRRLVGSGKAQLELPRLPIAIEGLALSSLSLALEAERLAWDGARVAGTLGWRGGLKLLELASGGQHVRVRDVRTSGSGALDAPRRELRGSASIASLAHTAPDGTAALSNVGLDLTARTAQTASGAQETEAKLALTVAGAMQSSGPGSRRGASGLRLDAALFGPTEELADGRARRVDAKLEVAEASAVEGGRHTVLATPSALFVGQRIARDAASPTGVVGEADWRLSVPSVRVLEGGTPSRPRASAATLAADGLELSAHHPLALGELPAKLALGTLRVGDARLEGLALDVRLDAPLGWSRSTAGSAVAQVAGRVASLRTADSRGVLDSLSIDARRLRTGGYRLALSAVGSSLVVRGAPVPERITAELRGEADEQPARLRASGALRGAQGASVALMLEATHARRGQRLRYAATLAAEKLEAFADLLTGALPESTGLKLPGAQLSVKAVGDLTGVLRATSSGLPEPVDDPISTLRGKQSMDLALQGLDYRRDDTALAIPALRARLESEHRDQGAGSAMLRLSAGEVRYQGGGTSVHLEGLEQRLEARFEQPPHRGLVDLRANLSIGSASQSALPVYPVRGLTLAAHVELDRLRSIFLREVALQNPAAGTTLRGKGAIELRTGGASGDDKTLAGREALALEGSLEQALEPFQKHGYASHARGALRVPFRLESGGLLGYRLLAALEARQVSIAIKDPPLRVEELDGVVPIIEEFALLPGGIVLSSGPRASPLTETRFADVHPFLGGDSYLTARSITLDGLSPLGPFAANVRIDRTDFLIDQLQVGFRGGQIVGQVRVAYRDGDPRVRLRLNATGVRSGKAEDVLDGNASLSFQPSVMALEGKVQLVRLSQSHLLGILDVVDPYHESASANRVRQALALGYPRFVRLHLHDGALDTKVELGGIAKVVRIDEIKAVPLGPILQRYLMPTLSDYLRPPEIPASQGAAPSEEAPE